MQAQATVAEQTTRSWYRRPAPLSPRAIEMTIRIQVPEDDGADVGIYPGFRPVFPDPYADELYKRLYDGVHAGLASVDSPFPAGGVGVFITHLRLSPSLTVDGDDNGDDDEVGRLGDTLEAIAASTVAALWRGTINLGAPHVP